MHTNDKSDFDFLRGPEGLIDDSIVNSDFDAKCCWPIVTPNGNVIFKEYADE